ncbi:MAG: hypothetical protein JXB46_06975, partial [Candidatus Eisenbacteria bacterium]|nr:hypothetical protein [Candidatus Eisenbacteria bacterium]
MGSRGARLVSLLSILAFALFLFSSCSKLGPGLIRQNLPPDTELWLTSRGDAEERSAVQLHWAGVDEDGAVVRFRVRLDSLDWVEVACTDSLFVLPLAARSDSMDQAIEYTFSVKAIDNDGEEDPTPAVVRFSSRNTSPETEIVHGPGDVTGPMVCIDWRGWDYDGVVVGYGYAVYQSQASEWVEVARVDSLPPDGISIMLGPLAGLYKFEVWSIDELGALDPTPAERVFSCNPALCGPLLTIETNLLGSHRFRGMVWQQSYDTPITLYSGEHLLFDWSAENDSSCPLLGYSYAYDDTTDWCQSFSLDETHFEVTPTPGDHSLYVATLGSAYDMTRARIRVDAMEASLDDYILIVDDYDHFESNPLWGTDEDRDAFYDSLASGYGHPHLQWDCTEHLIVGVPQPADAATLAGASTTIWYCDQTDPAIERIYDPLVNHYDWLGGYVRAGGNLILLGYTVLANITGDSYPITVTPSDTDLARAFVRDCLGIGYAECSGLSANKSAPWSYGYCFYGAVPGATGIPEGRMIDLEPMYIDSVGAGGYPEPGKWFMYTSTMPNYSRCGLGNVEAVYPFDGHSIEAYYIDAFLNVNFAGAT